MAQRRTWRKSSYSGGEDGQACVEVSLAADALVRDSKNVSGHRLVFTVHAWRAFTTHVA